MGLQHIVLDDLYTHSWECLTTDIVLHVWEHNNWLLRHYCLIVPNSTKFTEYLPPKLYTIYPRPWKLQCYHKIKQLQKAADLQNKGPYQEAQIAMQPPVSAAWPWKRNSICYSSSHLFQPSHPKGTFSLFQTICVYFFKAANATTAFDFNLFWSAGKNFLLVTFFVGKICWFFSWFLFTSESGGAC